MCRCRGERWSGAALVPGCSGGGFTSLLAFALLYERRGRERARNESRSQCETCVTFPSIKGSGDE